jgi:hypothetical protein
MRNLLGRLNARSDDDLQRIAKFWQVPLTSDRGRQVGLLYRTMSDVRAARSVMQRFDGDARTIVREMAAAEAEALPLAGIAELAALPEDVTREAAIRLFRTGILAREGDNQELPVGTIPRLFLPRELGLVFRRVQDEIDAGDVSSSPFRVLLEMRDAPEIEAAATRWGINVVPGLRARDDLIGQILRQVTTDRIERMVAGLRPEARRIWQVMQERTVGGPLALDDVLLAANLQPRDGNDAAGAMRVRDALDDLETSLLVLHTYDRSGTRALFVPREILQPDEAPLTVPLRPLEPVAAEKVAPVAPKHPHAIAWDVLTVLREIANHGAPVWIPGEPLSRSWQRRLNGRLWFSGEEVPPEGYLSFLLQLALAAGLLHRTAPPVGSMADRNAVVPVIAPQVREWRSRTFPEQSSRLRTLWLGNDEWIEARERGEMNVWGPDWRGFRRKLLEAVGDLDPDQWFMLRDLAKRKAQTDPALIGSTFTVASSHADTGRNDRGAARTATIAHIIRLELDTAFTWFGIVEAGYVAGKGTAIHVSERGQHIATDPEIAIAEEKGSGPAFDVTRDGTIIVRRPAPVHIWSLTAFADADEVSFEPSYQLRPRSVGRALGAGFDLDQIVTYLERHSGAALPDTLKASLAEWTAGYRRVRMRRAIVLTPDAGAAREDLERIVRDADLSLIEVPGDAGSLYVLLPLTDGDAGAAEETLLSALRASGYLGQWTVAKPNR